MRVKKVGNVYQLAFMPNMFPINCYLVEEQQELTLIDCGLAGAAREIALSAKVIGKPITRIALTHAHVDHVGALDALKKRFPDAEVSVSAREAKILAGDNSAYMEDRGKPVKGGVPKNIKTLPDRLLQQGDFVGSLEVFESPGHSPGSLSFFDAGSGVLIAGDAFQTRGGTAVSGTLKLLFPFPALATWDKKTALDSAKKLTALKPGTLAVGHGRLLEHPLRFMEQAIRDAEQKQKN
ncbi:MBL fold metallo-hydrolase [Planococcus sp. ISL-109]|uniref:MBL fold metallo-hydrolase n=1 Tax=Planococcus sp. ISL-109 TaxID=2819166 RepID=UPI001BE6FC48|nr:MBL fold metallo-hydrolase [Planococcus sp. ISL-109]MBT2581549.1 MBL fold metallo-hydrolase [Planococcus sp. ISL-109]